MLFNSYYFIFLFLPIVLLLFYAIGSRGYHSAALSWLVCASLFFYGWWNPMYLTLILLSVLFNFTVGRALSRRERQSSSRVLLWFGVGGNLAVLGYFKYANFFVDNVNALSGSSYNLGTIMLPLAISFFTFQQITYLVDAYRGETHEYSFLHYCLFVTFFPQLIAGPIVHHREILPQFSQRSVYRFNPEHLTVGLTIFFLGLFKKVVLADGIAVYATPVFAASEHGVAVTFFEAWVGALSYTFQLYFDFSGYSDMAIGLGRMFGIRLPMNFNSPYKATSIIDFWRRWHITLSRFLRDYLYIPLGGSRCGKTRHYTNLMITMLLGGLWHGAGWTFVLWGALHGFYLLVNHGWRSICGSSGQTMNNCSWWWRGISHLMTFMAIVVACVVFRAESLHGAGGVFRGMIGMNGFVLPGAYLSLFNSIAGLGGYLTSLGWEFRDAPMLIGGALGVPGLLLRFVLIWYAPNTQEFMIRFRPVLESSRAGPHDIKGPRIQWSCNLRMAFFMGCVIAAGVLGLGKASEFLYFNF